MSYTRYFCDVGECHRGGSHVGECEDCALLAYSEQVADVYRPHCRAIKQSMVTHKIRGVGYGYMKVVLQARLGCPSARSWVRRRRRVASGTYLGRWSWSWLPRGHKIPDEIPLGRVHILSGRV